jgi:hypothetical protein
MLRKLSTVLLVTMLVLTAFAPAAATAQETTGSTIDLTLTQDPATGDATLRVTNGSGGVVDATVNVSSTFPYAGNGTYTTDANGTVALPEPGQETTVMVTAEDGDDTATMDVQLSPVDTGLAVDVVQQSDGSATVTVTDDGAAVENASVNVTAGVAYEGTGEYDSGVDGTAELPNPEQNLTVTVTATNGSENVTTTAELDSIENGGYANFGQWISSYVQQLQTSGYFGPGLGQKVSEFATENNPGAEKRPDHAGPPDDAGATVDDETNATDEDEDEDTRGPPDHAKQGDGSEDAAAEDGEDDERGPPEHAKDKRKQDTDDETEEEETEEDETEEEEEGETENDDEENDDDSPGNSSDRGDRGNGAGNGGGNGNGRGK